MPDRSGLPRLVGKGRALELLLTGDAITADEAYRIGLVNRVVPAAELMAEAQEARRDAGRRRRRSPRATSSTPSTAGSRCPFAEAELYEATLFGLVSTTEDMREGTKAFLEKRKPQFKGK